MFALPVILKAIDGSHEFHEGCLFRLPPELSTSGRMARYAEVKSGGWAIDDLGYHIYSRFDYEGNLIIIPGIILDDFRPRRKIHGYTSSFSKAKIEAFALGIVQFEKRAFEDASENINMLIHDLRNISGSIYNAALEADTYINRNNWNEAKARVGNILAAQNILKIRTDVMDFMGNPASILKRKDIEVFRKVDKTCRVFKPKAQERDVSLYFSGESHSRVDGPEVFEIIPYALIDNAIKYSPSNSEIRVVVEDVVDIILLKVSSLGPKIADHERESIFEKGVRGGHAVAGATPGSGLGLFMLAQIVNVHFLGSVSVLQYPDIERTVNGRDYFTTVFSVSLPKC